MLAAAVFLVVTAIIPAAYSQTPLLNEALQAQGLLGSHFGVANTPASYDYVIVGGGTAGLTLAARLAANPSLTVAVIEAGGFYELDNGNVSTIPALAGTHIGSAPKGVNPSIDWLQVTEPQDGLGGREIAYAQGKTLGGGSARNSMWYHRSSKGAHDRWADVVGDNSYTWRSFMPYLQRSVSFTPPVQSERPENASALVDANVFIQKGGPVQVSYPNFVYALSSWIGRGLTKLGTVQLPGFSSGNLLGWSYVSFTIDHATGTRSSSSTAFLRQALQETINLQVYKNTLAKKITFAGKTATGVTVETAGAKYDIAAKKEVIVSAGVFRSPQLLMTSGVGPAEILKANNIDVVADRPGVGQNMWDHLLFGPSYKVNVLTASALANPAYIKEQGLLYATNRTGMLSTVGGDLLAFEKLDNTLLDPAVNADLTKTFPKDWPTIELLTVEGYAGDLRDETATVPPDAGQYAALVAALVAPFSRGNVSISSDDTAVNPVISPNWITDPRDQKVAIAAYKRVRDILSSDSIRPVIIGDEAYPGKNVTTDADILKQIQNDALTVYHASSTCAMGKANDPMAVVDPQAKVIGTERLRVVDASAFPFLPPGHPQSTVYALAEKIAEDILNGGRGTDTISTSK